VYLDLVPDLPSRVEFVLHVIGKFKSKVLKMVSFLFMTII
jgi:hypothetical protein